jgi:hypothetical protein
MNPLSLRSGAAFPGPGPDQLSLKLGQAAQHRQPAGSDAVRMPFDRSRRDRRRRMASDRIDVPDVLFAQLTRIAGGEPAPRA